MTAGAPIAHKPQLALASWLAAVVAMMVGIWGLHELGAHPAFAVELDGAWSWIGDHGPERVLLSLGRLLALGLTYWMLGSLLLATVVRAARVPGLVRSVDWITLPAVRRVADRFVAVSLAVSSVTAGGAGTALAAEQPIQDGEATPVVQMHRPEATSGAGYVPVPAADAPLVPAPTEEERDVSYTPMPAAETRTPPARDVRARLIEPADAQANSPLQPDSAYDYGVVAGDNLWLIAEQHLQRVLGRMTTDAETATYWSHLIDANRSRLRSGNPDLIYPGEIVECPAISDVGITG